MDHGALVALESQEEEAVFVALETMVGWEGAGQMNSHFEDS